MAIREPGILGEELRLKRILREPRIGSYLKTTETGEHYLISSGRHTAELYQMAMAFRFGEVRKLTSDIIVERIRNSPLKDEIDVLVGVAMGSIPLVYELQRDPLLMHTEAIWVEKERDPLRIRELKHRRAERFKKEIPWQRPEFVVGHNFRINPDKRVLVVEDVITTGATIRAVIDACCDYNDPDDPEGKGDPRAEANIVGVVAVINRMPADTDMLKISPVIEILWALRDPLVSWTPDECPLDAMGIPLKRI
ncbi:MAG: hypothetical protein HYW90_00010 [Candidatus Sungbacteria bacterium]|nr:hypothetical protein [Candidatus Sungbacteria bacterium]